MTAESVEVPFVRLGNRRGLTKQQIVEDPALMDFVNRFPCSFELDPTRDCVLFIEPEVRQ